MNYEEVIEVINEITARLGATATNLYPKLVRYGLVSNSLGVIVSLIILIISALALKKCLKKSIDMDDFDDEAFYIFLFIFATVGLAISAVVFYQSIHDLVLWITVPEIQSIDFILSYK